MNSSLSRRQWLKTGAALAAGLACGNSFADKPWPGGQPIRIIVPFPAGGVNDVVARQFADLLAPLLQTSIIVDNKPGAGGSMGMDALARSAPDGHTLAFSGISTLTLLPHVMKVAYDPMKQFSAVASTMYAPVYLLATKAFKGNSVADVLAAAKANTKGVTIASSGYGTLGHIMIEQFARQSGANLVHVPYKGGSQLITDAAGGQFDLLVANPYAPINALIAEGKLRVLAVTGPERAAAFAQVPTLGELGYQSANLTSLFGFYAPAGTPAAVVQRLNQTINAQLAHSEVQDKLRSLDNIPLSMSADQFQALIRKEWEANGKVVREAHIQAQ
ncbi:tripartite-type tricarboxylate transporter receptor subunit TctC [Comamonas odontotermitis]|uniref:Tripartite-type tricarboxylate transporter receptor subunit TctC n=1 Tax=Comamonas odontotermitis TaxID=379895 RepID=A0ABR6REN8_9BURK|nr:tripartite tricarboxylate transporter substrate binding protein [Comamonas odontotermitis]MBB6577628.1 tripartite-type tricarboxylate transporter receptor subunit TctC [Comamonas odontotermitis]